MDEYKFVKKYMDKNKVKNKNKLLSNKYVISLINRTLISALLLVVCLCITKINNKSKVFLEKNIYNKNISFSKINKLYESWFGKIYPIEKIEKNTKAVEPVFSEKLNFKDKSEYKEGVKLTVDNNYLVPVLESGIVVYLGNKDNYGYTIIVQQVNGVDIWYVGVKNANVKLYDYIEKGSLLGEVNGNDLYLYYQKDGKFISYKEYLE